MDLGGPKALCVRWGSGSPEETFLEASVGTPIIKTVVGLNFKKPKLVRCIYCNGIFF